MVAVSITADAVRVDDAESNQGWSSIGGGQGPSAEGSFPYQGGNLVNKKITNTGGVRYDPTSDGKAATDMTAASQNTWLVKGIISDYGGLNAVSGVRVQIGSATSAYHQYVISGTAAKKSAYEAYNARGGLLIIPINPNIAGYRDLTSGNPSLTATDHFGFEANFDSSSAKAENVGCDAIDCGVGLVLVGGDGASADGTWGDFVGFDEGIIGNRYGFAQSIYNGAQLIGFGEWKVGGTQATEFTDTESKIIWPDGYFAAGWSRVYLDLSSAGTVISDGATHTSLGTTVVEDTRADYVVTGTLGAATLSHALENFRDYTLTSAVTVDGASVEVATVNQNGATLTNSTIKCNQVAGVATLTAPDLTLISDCIFEQAGAGHAIEITTPGAYTLNGLSFNAFAANDTTGAAINNNSGGLVQILSNGGSTPTVRNGAGSTTEFLNSVTLEVRGLVVGSRVSIVRDSDREILSEVQSSAATFIYSYEYTADTPVSIRIISFNNQFLDLSAVLSTDDQVIPVNQLNDRVALNP